MEPQDYNMVDFSSNTTVEEVTLSYRWNIHKSILITLKSDWPDEILKSPVFTGGKNNQFTGYLRLSEYTHPADYFDDLMMAPYAEDEPYVPDVGLDLCLQRVEESVQGGKVAVSIQFSFLDGSDKPIIQEGKKDDVTEMKRRPDVAVKSYCLGSWSDILSSSRYIFNDHLNIHCRIWIHEGVEINQSCKLHGLSVLDKSLNALSDFKKLLESGLFSDFVIVTPTNEFKVHKNILSARSSVFATMFESQMVELSSGKMTISDFSDDIIKEMLNFIYSGGVENLTGNEFELMQIADKYNIEDLKLDCTAAIKSNLSVENAAKILIDADRRNITVLKALVIDFIGRNKQSVKGTEGFKALNSIDPKLFTELVSAIL